MLAEEASVIEGTLAILKMGVDRSTGAARHVISFAPYTHGGGALRTISRYGSEALRQFLIAEQLKRYGLGEMSIGASIMSYLST